MQTKSQEPPLPVLRLNSRARRWPQKTCRADSGCLWSFSPAWAWAVSMSLDLQPQLRVEQGLVLALVGDVLNFGGAPGVRDEKALVVRA